MSEGFARVDCVEQAARRPRGGKGGRREKGGPRRWLLVHGGRDETVPVSQSASMQAALVAAGKEAELLVLPTAQHADIFLPLFAGCPSDFLDAFLRFIARGG